MRGCVWKAQHNTTFMWLVSSLAATATGAVIALYVFTCIALEDEWSQAEASTLCWINLVSMANLPFVAAILLVPPTRQTKHWLISLGALIVTAKLDAVFVFIDADEAARGLMLWKTGVAWFAALFSAFVALISVAAVRTRGDP